MLYTETYGLLKHISHTTPKVNCLQKQVLFTHAVMLCLCSVVKCIVLCVKYFKWHKKCTQIHQFQNRTTIYCSFSSSDSSFLKLFEPAYLNTVAIRSFNLNVTRMIFLVQVYIIFHLNVCHFNVCLNHRPSAIHSFFNKRWQQQVQQKPLI